MCITFQIMNNFLPIFTNILTFEETDQVAVRMGDWKMVSKAGKPHLYDLSKDVHEDNDIAAQHPDIVKKMVEIAHSQHIESPYFKVTMPVVE